MQERRDDLAKDVNIRIDTTITDSRAEQPLGRKNGLRESCWLRGAHYARRYLPVGSRRSTPRSTSWSSSSSTSPWGIAHKRAP
jgi:hypothetical protein